LPQMLLRRLPRPSRSSCSQTLTSLRTEDRRALGPFLFRC
jgi:hypothetical protein